MTPEDITKIRGNLTRKAFATELLKISKVYLQLREDIKISDRTIIKYERGERTPNPWQEFLIITYDIKNNGVIYQRQLVDENIFILQKKD